MNTKDYNKEEFERRRQKEIEDYYQRKEEAEKETRKEIGKGCLVLAAAAALILAFPISCAGRRASEDAAKRLDHAISYGRGVYDDRSVEERLEEFMPESKGYTEYVIEPRCSGVNFRLKDEKGREKSVTVPVRAAQDFLTRNQPYYESDIYCPWWLDIILTAKIY